MSTKAQEFAALIGAKVTIPTRPLLQRRAGEARDYFTHTDVAATFAKLQKPEPQKLRRAK